MYHVSNPLFTIITVTYNVLDEIEKTIKSITDNTELNVEYLIIDGGSTDGTVEIFEKYSDKITYWESKPDKGIYDAMNKGIERATGKYICFINAGDILYSLPYLELMNVDYDLAVFPVELSSKLILYPKLNFSLKFKNTLPHQGCFYLNTKSLRFSLKYKVFSDFSLNQKLYKSKKRIKVFNEPITAYHDLDGISHDPNHAKEIFEVVRDTYGYLYQMLSWMYFKKQGLIMRLKSMFE